MKNVCRFFCQIIIGCPLNSKVPYGRSGSSCAKKKFSAQDQRKKKVIPQNPIRFFFNVGQILANSGTFSQWRAKSFLKLHQKFHTASISRDVFETEWTQKYLVKVGGVSAQILMKPSQLFWWRTIASLKCYRIFFVLIPSKKVPQLSIIKDP